MRIRMVICAMVLGIVAAPAWAQRDPNTGRLVFGPMPALADAGMSAIPDSGRLEVPQIGPAQAVAPEQSDSLDAVARTQTPAAVVDVSRIAGRHYHGDRFNDVSGPTIMGMAFDYQSEVYVTVLPPGADTPIFYQLGMGMAGAWRVGQEAVYRIELDVSIFRAKVNNIIIVRKDGVEDPLYEKRIRELMYKTYVNGAPVTVGKTLYRVFFGNNMSGDPAKIEKDRYGIVLVHRSDSGEMDRFIINYSDLNDGQTHFYSFFKGQRIGLRHQPNTTNLEFY